MLAMLTLYTGSMHTKPALASCRLKRAGGGRVTLFVPVSNRVGRLSFGKRRSNIVVILLINIVTNATLCSQ